MPLKFHAVQRKLLAGPHEGEDRFFAQVRCVGPVSFENICNQIAKLSTATTGDVKGILDNFLDVMIEELSGGRIVQLGELGNFRVCAGSRGVEPGEPFRASDMKSPRIVFVPGKMLRDAAEEISFEKLTPTVVKECPLEH